jgi:hypothetical protein
VLYKLAVSDMAVLAVAKSGSSITVVCEGPLNGAKARVL